MPVTPFHFGPGLLLNSAFPRAFSFTGFVLCQVLIDIETAYYLFGREYPVHRFFHSVPGGILVGLVSAWALWLCRGVLQNWLDRCSPLLKHELTIPALLVGGILGGISHSLLDNIMYSDVRLIYKYGHEMGPYDPGTGLHGIVSVLSLHLGCLGTFIVGAGVLFLRVNLRPLDREEVG
ncbi:MAG: hypothetical protein GY722_06165 [bacterium]|nr:hypothetical protein [bacterium]